MNRKSRLIFLVALLLLAWPLACRAEVTRFWFNVWTTYVADPANPGTNLKRLDVTVQLSDTRYRVPDAIAATNGLVVTAPDKTVLDLTKNHWNELRGQFESSYYPEDFLGGKIPPGTYIAKVTDKSGKSLTVKKYLNATFMAMTKITSPAQNAVLTTLKPTLKWTSITGAQLYDVQLADTTEVLYEPIYLLGVRVLQVYKPQFTLQTGVLKPGHKYILRIEARDSDKDMSRRCRTAWINFSTSKDAQ